MKNLIHCLSLALAALAADGAPLRTGFSYQGRLGDTARPANGVFEFRFTLFDAAVDGTQTAGPVTNANVSVIDGLFTTEIDFGAKIFDGTQYWLQIDARPGGSGTPFSLLAPRQPIQPAPYALHALDAAGVARGAINNDALAPSAVTADKIALGQAVKSLNGLRDDLELAVEGALELRIDGHQLVLVAAPDCKTYTNCFWSLFGNGNIVPGVNFLGTIAGELAPLEFRVNNNRSGLHVFTGANTAPNLIGGYRNNNVSGTGGTIGGGGQQSGINLVLADWGTISGGYSNVIQSGATGGFIGGGSTNRIVGLYGAAGGGAMNTASNYSFVGGGSLNRSHSNHGFIGGGYSNLVTSYEFALNEIPTQFSSVAGGVSNAITGGLAATIGGGAHNRMTGTVGRRVHFGTIAGGQGNAILTTIADSHYSSIGGGFSNTVRTAGRATIGGGSDNQILQEGHNATIGGGVGHSLDGPYGTISGGRSNLVGGTGNADYAAIGGGEENAIVFDSHYDTIAGGRRNRIQGFASNSSIGGGMTNAISGADFATIAGGGTNTIADNANFATIGGGRGNVVFTSAPRAVIPGGDQAAATNHNQYAFASGNFASAGDAQHSQYVLRNTSAGAGAVELFLDGVAREIVLRPDSTLTFDALVTGSNGTDSAGYQIRGVIERNAGGLSLVGAPIVTTLAEDLVAWSVSVQADAVDNALIFNATGSGVAAVRWVAHVRTVEVRF